jgi:Protein of unknown function (DUF2975)
MATGNRKLTEPLETTTLFFGSLFAAALILGAVATLAGTGTLGGLGHARVCVTDPNISGGRGDSGASPFTGVYDAKPGARLQSPDAPLSACARHPGFGQHLLYSLTAIPQILQWGGTLFLLWRLLVIAGRSRPFTARAAAAMRVLGWYVIAGAALAAAIEQAATVLLLGSLVAPPPEGIGSVAVAALRALVPVPALAGAALLTFARIVRLGAAMDDELQGTV